MAYLNIFPLQAYKVAKGKTWPLITTLCSCAAIFSAFLDNVTTILLLAPVTIRYVDKTDVIYLKTNTVQSKVN